MLLLANKKPKGKVERQTLWDQTDALATHLEPSYHALPGQVFSSPYIHADETHGLLLDKGPGKKVLGIFTSIGAHAELRRVQRLEGQGLDALLLL